MSANYDMASYLNMLDTDGKFIIVGAPAKPMDLAAFALIPNRKTVAGSLIGKLRDYFTSLCRLHLPTTLDVYYSTASSHYIE